MSSPESLSLTPAGTLHLQEESGGAAIAESASAALREAFGSSSAEGLLLLATAALPQELPGGMVFWRELSRTLFQRICQLGEGALDQWASIPDLDAAEAAEMIADAPPMRGLEYLTPECLTQLWRELRDLAIRRAKGHPQGAADWLRTVNPQWHLLGRVTFHLAENKRDPQRPFAFLATFAHRLSRQATVRHLPLADAVKTYASAQDQAKLATLLEPVRRAAEQSDLVRQMLESKALFAPQAWTIREARRFLTEYPRMEQAGVVVRVPDWWSARKPTRPTVHVRIGSRPASELGLHQLLDFDVGLALDGEPLTEAEQRQLMQATEGLILLRGKWVEVDRAQLDQALAHWKALEKEHAAGIGFIEGMRLLAGTQLEGEDEEGQIADWSQVTAGDWLKQTLERMRQPETISNCEPGLDLKATLRPYQVEGVRWLWFMTELGLGGCLADDMGLGKTIQLIDLLLMRKRQRSGAAAPALLIVPASLLGNWRAELARFAPSLRAAFVHRAECSAEELQRIADAPVKALAGVDLLITTYGLSRRQDWLEKVNWSLIVLDEAQAIKNAGATQTKAVKKLRGAVRLVLTGTPVENHLGDLWSLFDFCCPGLLGSAAQFKQYVKRLNKTQDAQAFGALRRLVRPYILRRLKTDPHIVPDLPEKTEMRAECALSKKQASLYQKVVDDVAKRLKDADGMARRGLILSMLTQLKQVCNHPSQFLGQPAFVPGDSGKFERLAQLCEPIVERQEKMLVFTQYQAMTQPLADFLATVFGRRGLTLHGGTPVGKRAELVRRFQDDDGPPFFVISLKAGGSGLNLTAASHVVHFDRWWNPAVEKQATDRAFRIGQKRNVLVHKFVCRGTVEERIDAMIAGKQATAERILDEGSETRLTEMSDAELLGFVALDIGRATAEE